MDNIVELESNHLVKDNIEKLKQIFPDIITDGKIDFDTLKLILGEEVETEKESYKFEWVGKNDCYKTIQTPSNGTLKYIKEDSLNPEIGENLIIEGDNLEVLKLLQSSYKNSIKMIYIDPPYNTGNDFVYPDNYETPLENYFELTGQKVNGENTQSKKSKEGRKHTGWLNMIFPRLLLSRTLLKEDGVIFISIDDNEVDNLKKLCNEVFGEENYLGTITIRSNSRGSQSSKFLSNEHEYLVCYGKNLNKLNQIGYTKEDSSDYNLIDDKGNPYRLLGLRQRGGEWKREQRPQMYYPIYINPENGKVSLEKSEVFCEVSYPKRPTGEDGRWTWGKDKFLKDQHLLIGKKVNRDNEDNFWDIFRIDTLKDENGNFKLSKVKTIWDEKEINYQVGKKYLKQLFNNEDIFDYPKPPKLIEKVITSIDLNNEIVLDFFGGSGTLGHFVLEQNKKDNQNRKFILVQLPEPTSNPDYPYISEITKERIRRVINGYGNNFQAINNGFKVFKLDNSNYKLNKKINVDKQSDKEEIIKRLRKQFRTSTVHDESLISGYKKIDIIYENILKEGYNLNSKIEILEGITKDKVYKITDSIKNKKFYITFDKVDTNITEHKEFIGISKDTLFICFDNHLYDSVKQNLSKTFQLKTM